MDTTQVVVHLDGSYVRTKIGPDEIVSHVDDLNDVMLYSDSGEISVALDPLSWSETFTVTYGQKTYTGFLIEVTKKLITLQLADGSVVTTRFDSYVSSRYFNITNTYLVAFTPQPNNEKPELRFFTESVKWTPSLVLDIDNKTLSLVAIITSERNQPFEADFTVVMYEEDKNEPAYKRMKNFSRIKNEPQISRGLHQDIVNNTNNDSSFIFPIGKMTLGGMLRYPMSMMIKSISPDPYNFIEVNTQSWNSKYDAPAVKGFIFSAPFSFPSSSVNISQEEYNSVDKLDSHNIQDPVLIKTYNSDTISFKVWITDVKVETSAFGSKSSMQSYAESNEHEIKFILIMNKRSAGEEKAIIILETGMIDIKNISVPPTKAIQKPGKIIWTARIKSETQEFNATIRYRV